MHFSFCDFFTSLGILLVLGSLLRNQRCYFSSVSLLPCKERLLWSLTTALTVRLWLLLHVLSAVTLLSVFPHHLFFLNFHFFFFKGGERFFHFELPQPLGEMIKASHFAPSPFAAWTPLTFFPFCS